jgi:hypothetical protein
MAWCSVKKRHRDNFTFTFYLPYQEVVSCIYNHRLLPMTLHVVNILRICLTFQSCPRDILFNYRITWNYAAGLDVFTVVTIHVVLWGMTPSNVVGHRRFGGPSCLQLQGDYITARCRNPKDHDKELYSLKRPSDAAEEINIFYLQQIFYIFLDILLKCQNHEIRISAQND